MTFASREAADAWLGPAAAGAAPSGGGAAASGAPPQSRLEAALGLVSNKGLLATNMNLFDAAGRIRAYASAEEVVAEFVPVRLDGYRRRREAQLEALCHEALVLEQRARFVELVCSGELRLHARTSGADLDAELEALGLARVEGSYRYLLSMQMASLTADRKAALEAQVRAKRAEIAELEAATPAQLWERDLDALEAALDG